MLCLICVKGLIAPRLLQLASALSHLLLHSLGKLQFSYGFGLLRLLWCELRLLILILLLRILASLCLLL